MSLSSMLNPSPDAGGKEPPPPPSYASANRRDSLPPITAFQSPEQTYAPYAQRPGSNDRQLPMPAPDERKMSSPTLERYHVPSRSPEQGRASISGTTLPSMHNLEQSAPEHVASHAMDGFTSTSEQVQQPVTVPASVQKLPPSPPLFDSSPATAPIKQEGAASPIDIRRPSTQLDGEPKGVASLKSEHSAITQSPLRESSVPVPTTESTIPDVPNPKKRPAPTKKKGTAMPTNKKAPPSKKRKTKHETSPTPSSITSKTPASKLVSSKGAPANSSPAPSTRSHSGDADDEPCDEDDEGEGGSDSGELYCICRKPDTGTFMIGCDGTCDDWFHGKCVNVAERDKHLIDKFYCPKCTTSGIGTTTWKRICRREGCKQPARIGKSKGDKGGSKYCSDECGVRFFRDMVARSRGREEAGKDRSSRRKSSLTSYERPSMNDDLGARGGVLAAGKLKALVDTSKSAEDFKKLGEGVLSPPATPDGNKNPHADTVVLSESELAALDNIARQKDAARQTHQLLKDRMKFVTMVKQAATRVAAERELKAKEYCGYDSRLEWTDARFARWRASPAGQKVFDAEFLSSSDFVDEVDSDDEGDLDAVHGATKTTVCERKKCARHLEWNKLAVDDVRAFMGENSDRMRVLEGEEKEVRERAALRQRMGGGAGEGTVEVHEPPNVESDVEMANGVEAMADAGGVKEVPAHVDGVAGEGPPALKEAPATTTAVEQQMVEAI